MARDAQPVGVYDPDPKKRLVGLLADRRIPTATHTDLSALAEALSRGEHRLAVVALETIGADARAQIEQLKSRPEARVILVHEESTPRARFAQRLWSIGVCDAVVSRAQPADLEDAIRRFELEAGVDEMLRKSVASDPSSDAFSRFRAAQNLFATMACQESTEGILREVSRRFSDLVDYEVLSILLLDQRPPRFFLFQSGPVAHSILFDMAEAACDAVNELRAGPPVSPQDLEYLQPTLLPSHAVDPATDDSTARIELCPLVAGAHVIGCLAVHASDWTHEEVYALYSVASHLAVALERVRALETARKLSDTDPLTGVHNRRFLDKILETEWSRARRYSLQLSVVIVDVDSFAEINELRGHSVGDRVLVQLADGLRGLVRSADHVLRIAADQFLLLLPETGAKGAERLIERVRVLLKTSPVQLEDDSFCVSVTCGVASHPTIEVERPQQLVATAHEALAQAKAAGRNRTVHAGGMTSGEDTTGIEQRREPRMPLELPVTFVPLPDLDTRSSLRLSSVNISAGGLALRDRARLLKRNTYGLVFFDDRPHPLFARVAWSKAIQNEYHAGLVCLKSGDFQESGKSRRWDKRKALVITSDPEHVAVAKRVLRTTKHAVLIVDPNAEISDAALAGCSLIVIGDRSLQGELGERLLEARRARGDAFRIIVLNEELDRERAIEMISDRAVEHLISEKDNPAEALFATLTKMLRPDFFGVHRYLLAGADVKSWSVTHPAEKSFVLAGVRTVAEDVDCHPRIMDLLISAVDEMLINALYRPEKRGVGSEQPVTVECGADGRLLCVGVLDDHGVLEVDQIYAGLRAAARARAEGISESAESAHLGFRIMLSALSQLAVNVEPGRRTEIIGIIDLRKSLRDHRASAPSLGIFKKQ